MIFLAIVTDSLSGGETRLAIVIKMLSGGGIFLASVTIPFSDC
jgi:hypothetical protein